jgi:hypothetical protein
MATSESFAEAPNGEARTCTALMLEGIALRHQIAVLKRSGTRRPRFRPWERLFWILVSRWWSLIIVQPQTVLRWRRDGWLALWRYRARGRWRGERPRVSREVRHLIVRMARDNFLWGAPRIHGELLMLGFKVSKPPCRATCPREADGWDHRGGRSFAIKPWRSVTASVPRSGRVKTLDYGVIPMRPGSSDPRGPRLRRYGLGSGAPLVNHGPP